MKSLLDFLYESRKIQGLNEYTEEEVVNIITDYINSILSDADIDIEIKEVWLHDSRLRNQARKDSDIDAVLFYSGNEREDDLFNALHDDEDPCIIEDYEVDINPVLVTSESDIKRYKDKSYKYDKEKLN